MFWLVLAENQQFPKHILDTTLQGRETRSLARFVIPRCPSTLSVTCPHVSLRTTESVPISCWGTVDYPNVAFLKHFAKKVPPKWLQNGSPKVPTLRLNLTFWDVFLKTFKIMISNCQWVPACVVGSYTLRKKQLLSGRTDARTDARTHGNTSFTPPSNVRSASRNYVTRSHNGRNNLAHGSDSLQ